MEILLCAASVAASSARSLLSRRLSGMSGAIGSFGQVNGRMSLCALAIITLYAVLGGWQGCSLYTIGMSLLYAAATLAAQLFYMRGLTGGDVAAVTFFYSCGFVIPTIAGTLLWHEELSAARLTGVALLSAAFWLCAKRGEKGGKSGDKGWIAPALTAMVCSGTLGLIQKLHQSSPHRDELGSFLVIAFAACALASFGMAAAGERSGGTGGQLIPTLVCGCCIGAANIVNLRLSGMLPALILFPLTNGGVTIVSALAAKLLWGEKIGRWRAAGMVLGVAAILLITL